MTTQTKKKQMDARVRTVRLAWTLESVPEIRRVLVEDLSDGSVPDEIVHEAETVVCELVSNAVRHAKPLPDGSVRVHWKVRAPRVELEVTDGGGEGIPAPKPPATWAPAGRGLRIVRSMAHEWGVSEERQGRTVWAALGGPSRRRA
ncbi:ATP-binding protein [Luteipulveratus halotolerans]|uniref:Regulatory protein n=1 Tax=Luteipulveratus halotolerans TaxID=1631356 RepID=A0A0L6CN92_9MICO|nr:ATP-binding protein [Luteipulveratus halotolerans]KNX38993.1 regulatory protein [Luteipulveratus halotolerans]